MYSAYLSAETVAARESRVLPCLCSLTLLKFHLYPTGSPNLRKHLRHLRCPSLTLCTTPILPQTPNSSWRWDPSISIYLPCPRYWFQLRQQTMRREPFQHILHQSLQQLRPMYLELHWFDSDTLNTSLHDWIELIICWWTIIHDQLMIYNSVKPQGRMCLRFLCYLG